MVDPIQWPVSAETSPLTADEVVLWCAGQDQPPDIVAGLRPLLAPDEIERADRFIFEDSRRRYIVARALLRILLGRYLEVDPRSLVFRYGPHGKPVLAPGQGDGRLYFNVSHSGERVLLAFCLDRDLGVDIEHIHPVSYEGIIRRNFSPAEQRDFRATPQERWPDAFFNGWTRKEAFIKATGEGLHHPLDAFDVTLRPDEPARLVATRKDPAALERWTLIALDPCPGYKAALCVEGRGWTTRCRQWRFG